MEKPVELFEESHDNVLFLKIQLQVGLPVLFNKNRSENLIKQQIKRFQRQLAIILLFFGKWHLLS